VLGILYKKFEDKRLKEEDEYSYQAIQKYLLDDETLAKSKKPILWIHIPYEYNSRKWQSFGSRSSYELNQPYLYLTVRSIINHCDNDFTICIIDDNSFKKLMPEWNVNMDIVSDPILSNVRKLGLMKLLYKYGGLMCPVSFLCIKDLIGLYSKGTRSDKMFVCETVDRNITSTTFDFYPNLMFCGAPKECEMVKSLIDFISRTISSDYTAESVFLGEFNRWINKRIENGQINMINGIEIGTKTPHNKTILVDDLLSNSNLDIYKNAYGILIPAREILTRRNYEWFSRLSVKQVLQSNTILGNYMLANTGKTGNVLEPLAPQLNNETKNEFVGFWRTPDYPGLYGLKPNFLGDNLIKQSYTSN
jgi:glycosyltransferase involved in cell wall biosynthesis